MRFKNLYQFKITLENVSPLVWRRILVPDTYSFWDFHVAIQDSMGWLDYHLHNFETANPLTGKKEIIGIPDDDFFDENYITLPGWRLYIKDYFTEKNRTMPYLYDYGDCWNHQIEFEGIIFKNKRQKYPLCIAGANSCPPEDCGGPNGYENVLSILKNSRHEEHDSMRMWAGENFDSKKFDPKKVKFDDPTDRWNYAFRERLLPPDHNA